MMNENISNTDVEHTFIQSVLKITIRRSEKRPVQDFCDASYKLYIGHLYGRTTGIKDTETKLLTVDDIDDVVRASIYSSILHNKNVFIALNDAFARSSDIFNKTSKGESWNSLIPEIDGKSIEKVNVEELKKILETIINTLTSNATLLMLCPLYFNLTDIISEHEIKRSYLNISDDKVRSKCFLDFLLSTYNTVFLQKILTSMWNDDENVSKVELSNVFNEIRVRISLKPLGSKDFKEIGILLELLSFKPLVELFLDNIIRLEVESPFYNNCGVKRELFSILGRFLSVTTLNEEIFEISKFIGLNREFYENVESARTSAFHGIKDLNRLKQSMNSKRTDSEIIINNLLQLFKDILKTGSSARTRCLSIFGRLIGNNSTRRKVLRLTQIDSSPLTLEPLYHTRMSSAPDCSFGFSINLVWLLLLLSQGISIPKVSDIDPFFCQISNIIKNELKNMEVDSRCDTQTVVDRTDSLTAIEAEVLHMLGFLVNSPSCMGDDEEVHDSLKKMSIDPVECYNGKFVTQIFWLTLYGIIMLFLPALQENLKILSYTLNYANVTPNLDINDDKLATCISHVYTWRAAMQHPSLIKALWHFINISLRLFLRCSLIYKSDGTIDVEYNNLFLESKGRYGPVVGKYCNEVSDLNHTIQQSPQLAVLPVDFIECILDVVKNMCILRKYDTYIIPVEKGLLDSMDFDLVISTCIFLMKSPNNIIKNVHIRCELACSTILYLCKYSGESMAQLENHELAKLHLMDALCKTFISSQKSSYNSRISSRLNIIQSLSQFFVVPVYKKSFVTCIISKKDIFVQFMHLLLNDTTFLIEEVVSYLSEIRRRELAGISLDEQPNEERATNSQNEDDVYTQEGAIDANQLKTMSGSELKVRTRSFVEYGYEICALLCILCSGFPGEITNNNVLLPQVSTCLGCCLESLAGQKCLQLKVKNMQEYGFKPKEWLSKIMQCYISLYLFNDAEDVTPFIKAIVQDERYYKPETFNRCIRFATRDMFLNYRSIKSFNALSNKLLEYAKCTSMMYDTAVNEEIPESYLDPIMMDIMEDPVLLPSSGKIMDRKNIERYLMSESTDPFTRAPLAKEDLVEQPELKAEILSFLKSLNDKNK